MYSHLHEHKAFHQYQNFCLDVDVVDAPWRQANKIDQVLGQAFQTAECHCSKTPRPPWSVKLHLASLKVRYWQTALTARRTGVTQSTVRHNLAAEIWCDDSPPSTPRSTKILKHVGAAAQKALRRIRRNAAAKREAFLLELKTRIALRMSSKDADADAALKNIERQLSSGRRFHRIAGALKPMNNAALTKVEIVTKQSHIHPRTGNVVTFDKVQIIDTQHALEAAIIDRNKRHFAQAGGTPFTREPFSRIGSDNGYNVYLDADGTEIHVPEESFLETKTVMELLRERHDANPHRWSDNVSFEEFISGLLHWNEATSSHRVDAISDFMEH
jgi:hypothetical protein